jgi:hypothetical protein
MSADSYWTVAVSALVQSVRIPGNGLNRHPDVVPHAADKHALYALVPRLVVRVLLYLLRVFGSQFPEQPKPVRYIENIYIIE